MKRSGIKGKLARLVYERDKKCRRCGRMIRLEIHHIRSVSNGGNDELDNLALLCSHCHMLAPDEPLEFYEYISVPVPPYLEALYVYMKFKHEEEDEKALLDFMKVIWEAESVWEKERRLSESDIGGD